MNILYKQDYRLINDIHIFLKYFDFKMNNQDNFCESIKYNIKWNKSNKPSIIFFYSI